MPLLKSTTNTTTTTNKLVHCVLFSTWTTSAIQITTIIGLLVLGLSLQVVNSARIQTYTLYSELDSKGDNESFTQNVQDLYNISKLIKDGQVKWKCIERGIWLEYSGINYNFKNRNSFQYYNIEHGPKCFSPARPVQSIRHIGNVDLELPGLSLYKRENFTGEELYFDGTTLQLPVSISFRSFGFTGLESWLLYSGTDFTGESNVCIQPQKIDELMHKNSISDSQMIFHNHLTPQPSTVGSLRRGCGPEEYGQQTSEHQGQKRNSETNKRNPDPSLNLYTRMDGSHNILFMDGTEMKLPGTGHRFIGYTIGGSSNWTIYNGNEFNGDSVCLVALEGSAATASTEDIDNTPNAFGSSSGVRVNVIPIFNTTLEGGVKLFQVASIRRGCETDGSGSSMRSLFLSSFYIGIGLILMINWLGKQITNL